MPKHTVAKLIPAIGPALMRRLGFKPIGYATERVPHSLTARVRFTRRVRAWKHESLTLEFELRPTPQQLLQAVLELGQRQGRLGLQAELKALLGIHRSVS